MNKKKFRKVEPYIWMAPSMILMGIFIIIPIFVILRMSLSKVTRAGIVKEFTGFDNFLKVIHTSAFPMVLKNTVVWTIVVVGLSTLLGFILALILNENPNPPAMLGRME